LNLTNKKLDSKSKKFNKINPLRNISIKKL